MDFFPCMDIIFSAASLCFSLAWWPLMVMTFAFCNGLVVILFLNYRLQILKGELQCENKLISYEKEFKMLENDMCITVIGQAILKLLIKL